MDKDILEKINQKLDTTLDNTKLENISRITIEIDEYEDEFVE
jgi:hypothetical protein